MHILIVSDIHANNIALEAVLSAAGSIDTIWCLGDTIGYGPRPNECVERMREAEHAISGNHDLACIGAIDLEDFNPDARTANTWNGDQLMSENLQWLKSLYTRKESLQSAPAFAMAHGSPREPVWEYLLTIDQAIANFNDPHFQTQVCFIGHSHVPIYFRLNTEGLCQRVFPNDQDIIELDTDVRYIINPGSVGQPRNQDRRAAYAILDTDAGSLQFHRIDYDFVRTQEQMRAEGLPIALIRRLAFGI